MHNKTMTELAAALRSGACSSVELTRHYLERIERLNPVLNTFITIAAEPALIAAARADQVIAAGAAGPLTGIPIAHKDIFCTQGLRTSCGSRMLDNFIAALRRHRGGASGRRRRRGARQDQHGRVRHGLVQRDELVRPGQEPLGPNPRPRRVLRRLRRGRRRAPVRRRHRHRYRRLHPPARGTVRHHRASNRPTGAVRAGA